MPVDTDAPPLVAMRGITIRFPGVLALDGVDFVLRAGEVHSVMGENGAGKSTLIKALTGVYAIDAGTITVAGEERLFGSTADAQRAGISTVYQEVNLCTNLSVGENVMLGHEPRTRWGIDWKASHREAARHLESLGLRLDTHSLLSSHSIAVQQLVAISRAMVLDARVLILDEPTSSLDRDEVDRLFTVIRDLRDQGVAILFVSHFLEQVYEISDRITVLRNGKLVGEYCAKDLPRGELVTKMVGPGARRARGHLGDRRAQHRPLRDARAASDRGGPARRAGAGRPRRLRRRGRRDRRAPRLRADRAGPAALRRRPGRRRRGRGARRARRGSRRRGTPSGTGSPSPPRTGTPRASSPTSRSARTSRSASRLGEAGTASSGGRSTTPWSRSTSSALGVRPADPNAVVGTLSGGNQQKVLLARWLATAPELIILDEPTRGIDVGAKADIQRKVAELSSQGLSVIFISSELEEVLRLAQRVVVMRDRRQIGVLDSSDVDVDGLIDYMANEGEGSVA